MITQVLETLRDSIIKGDITKQQAKDVRKQLGIHNSYFTKKKSDKVLKKAKRKMAYKSKRINRLNGSADGQPRVRGTR